jgi:sugar phosphate isomerase/epimerase
MLDRRAFLGSIAAAGLSPRWARRLFADKLERIGVQLYTVRASMQRDMDATLEGIARIGYKEVEFAGYFGRSPSQVRIAVERQALTAPGSHLPYERLTGGWTRALDEAAAVGHRFVVIAWVPEEARATLDDWQRVAELLNRSGHAARAAGLRFAYHTYTYDFTPIDGVVPFDRLAASTDPDAVAFELDVYWALQGGADPLALLDRYPGRFPLLHVKDAGPAPKREMVDIGDGTVDWKAVLSRRAAAGTEHVFVEHDDPLNALRFLNHSYRYLRRLSF